MTDAQPLQVNQPVLPVWRDADRGHRLREMLYGEQFVVQQEIGGLGFGSTVKDGYEGFVDLSDLQTPQIATHWISGRATHLYSEPDIKSAPHMGLSFGSQLTIHGTNGIFLKTSDGYFIPAMQTQPVDQYQDDPATVAEMLLGAPYLWGGNSCWGIDCSGLVQASLLACGLKCPADSDQQQDAAGQPLGHNARIKRGDLLFWKGHVAMALDNQQLIHATAYHMAVVVEGINDVIVRIADQGLGPVLARRRP